MRDPAVIQRAYTAITRHFVDTGRAPHYAELARLLDLDVDETRDVQREVVDTLEWLLGGSAWLARDTDLIESWAPFSNVPNHILVSVDGLQKWYGQ